MQICHLRFSPFDSCALSVSVARLSHNPKMPMLFQGDAFRSIVGKSCLQFPQQLGFMLSSRSRAYGWVGIRSPESGFHTSRLRVQRVRLLRVGLDQQEVWLEFKVVTSVSKNKMKMECLVTPLSSVWLLQTKTNHRK